MRISIIDLQCEDIMWFGVDKNNYIFECTSAGCGNVPEFVCCSKENTNKLIDFFMEELKEKSEEKLLCEYKESNELLQYCISMARKGIYCYDISQDDGHINEYKKIVEPVEPLSYEELPEEIKELLIGNKVNIDVITDKYINLKHAY